MNRTTAISRCMGMLMLLLFTSFFSFSQNNFKVTGKVTDDAGKPVDGATVQVKGSATATATKADGTFEISVSSGNATLVISHVGFVDQEIAIGGNTEVSAKLVSAAGSLEDAVVVGYGTRKRVEVTGATSSISGENLRSVQTTNLTQSLQGRVAGVVATPGGFRPGAGSSIRIRGNRSLSASNEPLYVVDGFPVSYTIDDMNPADIESVDILKDASATAIYGVRGANGVVQITTKKGRAGKISISY